MKRGDLDQPRTGAPGDLDQPGSGGSEPAIAGDDALDDAAAGPRDHDHMQQAVDAAAAIAEETGGLGRLGRPMNRRSPFFVGMAAAAGVAVTYGLVELLIRARSVLVLIGLALFIAAGLDPAVKWLTRRRLPRWAAVIVILLIVAAVVAGFVAAAVPPLTAQVTALVHELPHYVTTLKDHNSELGKLNSRFQIEARLTKLLSSKGTALVGGVLGPARWCSARPARCWSSSCWWSTSWPRCRGSSCSCTGWRRSPGGRGSS